MQANQQTIYTQQACNRQPFLKLAKMNMETHIHNICTHICNHTMTHARTYSIPLTALSIDQLAWTTHGSKLPIATQFFPRTIPCWRNLLHWGWGSSLFLSSRTITVYHTPHPRYPQKIFTQYSWFATRLVVCSLIWCVCVTPFFFSHRFLLWVTTEIIPHLC